MCKNCARPGLKLVKGNSKLCSRCYKIKLYGEEYARKRPPKERGTCTRCKQERLLVNKRRECRRCRYDAAEHRSLGDWSRKQKRNRRAYVRRKMLVKALGECAICHRPAHLQLDHKHDLPCGHGHGAKPCAGCRRDYLCHLCNKGLGMFKDSPSLLEEAKSYLLKWEEKLGF